MDINNKIQEVTDRVIAEKLEGIIEKEITSTMVDIIHDSLRSYSDFGKKVKEAIQTKMDVSLEKLDLISYNEFIVKAIETEMLSAQMANIEPIKKRIQEIVGIFDKKEINLSEIVDKFKDEVSQDSSESSGEITFICEKSNKYSWYSIYMDTEPDTDKYSCKFSFTIHGKGTVYGFRFANFLMSERSEITPSLLSSLNSFEKWMFRLTNSNVKVIVDDVYPDTEWMNYED
jgi:BMFP domain-containing protein YqiC